jgi:hypothetical protein
MLLYVLVVRKREPCIFVEFELPHLDIEVGFLF